MQRRAVDSQLERRFVSAMVSSEAFLAGAVAILRPEWIDKPIIRRIAEWCLDHYRQYRKPPSRAIRDVFAAWADTVDDEMEIAATRDLLSEISRREETINVAYLLDQFRGYLLHRRLERLRESVGGHLSRGDTSAALEEVGGFRADDLSPSPGVDVLRDRRIWRQVFADLPEPLIHFPGDAGQFFGSDLARDCLLAIQGPSKRGKSFWCIEYVVRALRERRRVAFFQLGDLSLRQVMLRLASRLAMRPIWNNDCGRIRVPVGIDVEGEEVVVRRRLHRVRYPVSLGFAIQACRRFTAGHGHGKGLYLMLSVHANSSITVAGIDGILRRWEQEKGFVADVIVLDYADILAPESARKEERHAVNDTWKALRRLSQERHALVITPTQAKASSFDARLLSMKHFSEDNRKLAHVTGMIGLNQTPEEKEQEVMRLNWIVRREAEFHVARCLYVAQCLRLGRAFCYGSFSHGDRDARDRDI